MKRESRRYKRYNIDTIHGSLLHSSDISVVDISLGGAAIETIRRLTINKEYSLTLRYKDYLIKLRGFIAWSFLSRTESRQNGESVPVYKVGMKFTKMDEEKAKELLKFIYDNKVETINKGNLAARFKVKDPDNANVIYPHDYLVRQLSLSGMMVESDVSYEVESRHDMEVFFLDRSVPFTGRIVNCIEFSMQGEKHFKIGIEFISMDEGDREFFKEFLDKLEKMQRSDVG